MTGSFLSTVVMCTVTALALTLYGGVGENGATGGALTYRAFQGSFSGGGLVVSISTVLFGFTTLLGWAFYGERCVEYMLGEGAIRWYRILFTLMIIPGGLLELGIVWQISDVANAMMAIPTLIGITLLAPVVVAETKEFLVELEKEEKEEKELASA
jgi:AGCS family alanine or glycine:cation symporter